MAAFPPIDINIPIEIDAGSFGTTLTVQGELVSYSKVHIPLLYESVAADPSAENMGQAIQWAEDQTDQTQVTVTVDANGRAVVKSLFKAALAANSLECIGMTSGVIYSDGTARNTVTDVCKYYESADSHLVGAATLKKYLQQYLYAILSAAVGLAASTGDINIALSRENVDADEIIAEALVEKLCALSGNPGVEASALRQNIYEQMFTMAPERFAESTLRNSEPGADTASKNLPFVVGDSLAFLVTFKFPGSQISAPVVQNALRTTNSQVYVATGNKISVIAPENPAVAPVLSDFPNCTVMLRAKLEH